MKQNDMETFTVGTDLQNYFSLGFENNRNVMVYIKVVLVSCQILSP